MHAHNNSASLLSPRQHDAKSQKGGPKTTTTPKLRFAALAGVLVVRLVRGGVDVALVRQEVHGLPVPPCAKTVRRRSVNRTQGSASSPPQSHHNTTPACNGTPPNPTTTTHLTCPASIPRWPRTRMTVLRSTPASEPMSFWKASSTCWCTFVIPPPPPPPPAPPPMPLPPCGVGE